MPRVFICYSRKDSEFVDKLTADLKAAGVPTWRDVDELPEDELSNQRSWRRAINKALRECTHMVIVLSPDSVESEEVEAEWNYFLKQGPIFPVIYRECDVPYRLNSKNWIDLREGYDKKVAVLARQFSEKALLKGFLLPKTRHPHGIKLSRIQKNSLLAVLSIVFLIGISQLMPIDIKRIFIPTQVVVPTEVSEIEIATPTIAITVTAENKPEDFSPEPMVTHIDASSTLSLTVSSTITTETLTSTATNTQLPTNTLTFTIAPTSTKPQPPAMATSIPTLSVFTGPTQAPPPTNPPAPTATNTPIPTATNTPTVTNTLAPDYASACSNGTIAFWPMREGSGNQIVDVCSNHHVGTWTGGVGWGSDQNGTWLQFGAGDNSRVTVNSPSLSQNTSITVEIMMMPRLESNSGRVFSQLLPKDGGQLRFTLDHNGSRLLVWGGTGVSGEFWFCGQGNSNCLPTDKWTLVSFQVTTSQVTLYHNGQQKGSGLLRSEQPLRSTNAITEIGTGESIDGFDGKIMYIRISDKIRSDFLLARP